MDGSSSLNKRKRNTKTYNGAASDSGEDQSDIPIEDESPVVQNNVPQQELGTSRATPVVIVDSGFATVQGGREPASVAKMSYIGSALKTTPDGSVVPPRVVKKKSTTQTVCILQRAFSLGVLTL